MATQYRISLNMEYCRSADMSFAAGVQKAADLGYHYVEPMVHTGWELLSEVDYFHSFSMEEDPLLMRDICQEAGIEVSSLSGHSPLMKPATRSPRRSWLPAATRCSCASSHTESTRAPRPV